MKWTTQIQNYQITIKENEDRVFDVDIEHLGYGQKTILWFVSLASAKRYIKTEYGEKDERIKWTKVT